MLPKYVSYFIDPLYELEPRPNVKFTKVVICPIKNHGEKLVTQM